MNATRSVWYAEKPGEERRHCSTLPFTPHHALVLREDGYSIFRLDFELSAAFEPADSRAPATKVGQDPVLSYEQWVARLEVSMCPARYDDLACVLTADHTGYHEVMPTDAVHTFRWQEGK